MTYTHGEAKGDCSLTWAASVCPKSEATSSSAPHILQLRVPELYPQATPQRNHPGPLRGANCLAQRVTFGLSLQMRRGDP